MELQADEFNLIAEDFGHSENFSVKILWLKGDVVFFQWLIMKKKPRDLIEYLVFKLSKEYLDM